MTATVAPPVPPELRRRGQIFMVLASVAWSIAGVMQRGLGVGTATQMAGRAFFALVALTGVSLFEARRTAVRPTALFRSIGRTGVAAGCCMAGASASFVIALNHSSVANVLFIQALAPFVAVVLSRIFLGEHASTRTWFATAVALVGVAVMVGGPHLGSAIGLVASSVMMLLFAIAIVITRHRRDVSMAPAMALSQFLVLVGSFGFAHPSHISGGDLWRLVVLGLFQMGVGQLCFVIGARLIPAAETALITLLEVVLGPLWVWLAYREDPGTATLVGGVVVLVAVVYQATEQSPPELVPFGGG